MENAITAKARLVKDITTLAVHLDDIFESDTIEIEKYDYNVLARKIVELKKYLEDLQLTESDGKEDKPKVSQNDIDAFLKSIYGKSQAQDRSTKSTSCGVSANSCGASIACGHGGPRGGC